MGSKGLDVKKSSFYVWFLGAKESRGLRGEEYISPVVKQLTSREREQEPIKVTLEVTGKGLKIVQNLAPKRTTDNYRENIKHFIPSSSITCAVQEPRPNSDIVSVILLIYNPATSCPVHVHSYRCDSGETATLLLDQLNRLINRPENQKKFQEIESRLQAKGLLQRNSSSAGSSRLGSDGRSLGRGSDSGAGSDKGSQLNPSDRIASMYDSLAAELREKLGAREPLLLPPRDYDTMHRSKGNIAGIEERRSHNPRIVGSIVGEPAGNGSAGLSADRPVWSPAGDSSGNSSGIGSKSPSPVEDGSGSYLASQIHNHNYIHQDSNSSDEEWGNGVGSRRRTVGDERNQSEDSLLLPPDQSWSLHDHDSSQGKPLSSRFFPSKRSVSPNKSGKERKESPDCPKERFRGAKQLFMSLERKKDKNKDKKIVKGEGEPSPHRVLSPNRSSNKEQMLNVLQELQKTSLSLEAKQLEGQARWSRYEREAMGRAGAPMPLGMLRSSPPDNGPDSRWPKSDKDTGYVSRYSRDKSRSRDFDESPPAANHGRGNIFTKSGKKSSTESKDKYTSKRLSRFLSRETLESDGYDKIDEFDEPDPHRNKVKRNPSRTSLKLDYRRQEDPLPEIPGGPPSGGPRRGMLRREMTELDMKGYMQAQQNRGHHFQPADPRTSQGLSRKYNPRQGPVWLPGGPPPSQMHHGPHGRNDRSLSPARALSPMRSGPGRFTPSAGPHGHPNGHDDDRFPVTKIILPEYNRKDMRGPPSHSADRYPSLDLRNEKRKSMFEQEMRNFEMGGHTDYRRRSYHELSEVDKLDPPITRNFQHSGRKMGNEPAPLGLPSRTRNIMSYKQLPDQQRFPGLDRENSRINSMGPIPFKSIPYNSKPIPFDHPSNRASFDHHMSAANRPAMYRHSYAETSPPPAFIPPPQHMPGRGYGLSSLKPF